MRKPQRPDVPFVIRHLRVFVWLVVAAFIVPIGVCVYRSRSTLSGSVSVVDAHGDRLTFAPRRCSSGDFWWRPFYGVHFAADDAWVRALADSVVVAGPNRTYEVRDSACDLYEVDIRRGRFTVQRGEAGPHLRVWGGVAKLDCAVGGARITMDLKFDNCAGDGAVEVPPAPGVR